MATFTNEELNAILTRGFDGSPMPLKPVLSYRRNIDGYPLDEWYEQPQILVNLGDIRELSNGNVNIEQTFWTSAVEVESEDYYDGVKSFKIIVQPTYTEPNLYSDITIQYVKADGTLSIASTSTQGFREWVSNWGEYSGNAYLTLVYSEADSRFRFAIGCSEFKTQPGIIPQEVYSTKPLIFISDTQYVINQPYRYFLDEGDPDYYDIETQTPEMGTAGGGGSWYRPSDTNWFSGLPTLDILTFGMVSQYSVDTTDMSSLASFLWSDSFINSIKKAWQSPFENIINLSFIPLGTELSTVSDDIKIGNVPTGITSAKLTKSLYSKDFGSINMYELYKNFADYSPFTHISLYVPGCGIKNLNPDDFIDGSIHLMAYIDTFSGTIVYQVGSIRHGRKHIVDHYTGNIQTSIPITGANYASAYSSLINGLAGIGSGGMIGGAMSALTPLSGIKPEYGKSSGTSGSAMRLSVQRPYIFYDTPQLREPKNFRYLHGYVSNTYQRLGDCKGFTTVKYMDMKNINLTDTEKEELKNILETGVYINDPPTP